MLELVLAPENAPAIITGIISSLIAGYIIGALHLRTLYRQRDKAALTYFWIELKKIIDSVHASHGANPNNQHILRTAARVIVSVRDSFLSSLSALSHVLNSNIDRLEKEVKELEEDPKDVERIRAVAETIDVLQKTWPMKGIEIEIRVRRVLAEIGLTRI